MAVFHDDKFYFGNTIYILNPMLAQVKFVEQTEIRENYFRWPRSDDIAVADAELVFGWGFDLLPVGNKSRAWRLDCLNSIRKSYNVTPTSALT